MRIHFSETLFYGNINCIMSKLEVLFAIHNFSEMKSLANKAKISTYTVFNRGCGFGLDRGTNEGLKFALLQKKNKQYSSSFYFVHIKWTCMYVILHLTTKITWISLRWTCFLIPFCTYLNHLFLNKNLIFCYLRKILFCNSKWFKHIYI